MSMQQILDRVRSFDGILELAPREGSEFPSLAWGDHFFYFAPDGRVPEREQPYATIVTKNYPDDSMCELDDPDRWRLNIQVGRNRLSELTGALPGADAPTTDYTATDVVLPHPLYSAQGWVSITNPGEKTQHLATRLLREAHSRAQRRTRRKAELSRPRDSPDSVVGPRRTSLGQTLEPLAD